MNFDCESFCSENSFVMALTRFGLFKGVHCTTENPIESLVNCLSILRPAASVINDINMLKSSSREIPADVRSLYEQGLEIEYGLQKSLLTENSCPNIALMSSLSNLYNSEMTVGSVIVNAIPLIPSPNH